MTGFSGSLFKSLLRKLFKKIQIFKNKLLPKLFLIEYAVKKGYLQKTLNPHPFLQKKIAFKLQDEGYCFNPSLYLGSKGMVLVYRYVGSDKVRKLKFSLLSYDKFEVIVEKKTAIGLYENGAKLDWCADPRFFLFRGRLYLTYNTGHSEVPNEIYIQEVNENLVPKSNPIKLIKKDGRRSIEKNWGFFEYNNDLFAVYSISPFVVLKVEMDRSKNIANAYEYSKFIWDSNYIEEKFGELRGGASPIKIGGEFYYITQSHVKSLSGDIYTGSMISFTSVPPFRPVKVACKPLFKLSVDEYRMQPKNKLNGRVEACFYPCGAAYQKDSHSLFISYGINDCYSGMRIYRFSNLVAMLENVKGLDQIGLGFNYA
ncbi:hypothetical protein [Marinobacterium zhoushanense]|nr:hypothetical protein [Marinobacterium zhoushanense]